MSEASRFALWPWLQVPLQAALSQLHSHAALLHGPEGVGQFDFALALARAWLCEQHPPGQGGALSPACGRCVSCHLMEAGSHPDFQLVLPEALQASLGWVTDGEADDGEKSSSKSRKPSQEIKVDAIRAVVQFAQHTASRGRAKVVLIHPVERMNTVAANTLLKTLEEPPGQVRFVLSGAALDALLPTVRSRCQAWRLPLPDAAQASAWLAEQVDGLDLQAAELLLAAAGGQPLTARDRAGMGLDARSWPLIPKAVAQGEAGSMSNWPLPLVVETLQKLCHDLGRAAVGAPPRYFPADSLPPSPDLARLNQWAQELGKVSRHADHPWNLPLKLETLMLQARSVLRVRPSRPAVAR